MDPREKQFRKDLARVLKKHGAQVSVPGAIRGWDTSRLVVEFPHKRNEFGEVLQRGFITEIELK